MRNNQSSFLSNIPPIVKNILAINIVLFAATFLLPGILSRFGMNVDLNDILGMHYFASHKFNPAQMITYMFMHGSFSHIFFNMFAVYMFGGIMERVWGPKKFLFFYLISGLGAAIVQQLFWYIEFGSLFSAINSAISAGSVDALLPYSGELHKYLSFDTLQAFNVSDLFKIKSLMQDSLVTIGASGSVFGLLLAFGWLFPEEKLFLMFIPIPIKARWFVLGYGVIELFLGVAQFSGDSVAHFAHLGGMLFGAILLLYWKRKGQLYK
ncbi:MAG: Rhomboid family protein [Bacteroidetes bacterium]|nr:Rhomboid family protein [Bacteroidota bacterium]